MEINGWKIKMTKI